MIRLGADTSGVFDETRVNGEENQASFCGGVSRTLVLSPVR